MTLISAYALANVFALRRIFLGRFAIPFGRLLGSEHSFSQSLRGVMSSPLTWAPRSSGSNTGRSYSSGSYCLDLRLGIALLFFAPVDDVLPASVRTGIRQLTYLTSAFST